MKQENGKKNWLFWALLIVGEAIAAGFVARWQGLAMANPLSLNARYLSDGCFVVGLVMTGVGLMTWVSTTGFFDMMGYGVRYGIRAFVGMFGANRKPNDKSFYEYKLEQDEKRGKPLYALTVTGVMFILLSVLFLALYYNL